ncbi:hypothetical protein GWI33_001554 [Rhynchophorus ferrugineus]|uniref:C-type lectin domain-containing protein n=1 Tax=Rhynchophorus ferrugineus TaxID=354439 RepID=A0A834MLR3_RHYFE|nr:hypothetical protein GWI33_001554 [Rhynchophorus ferrugineus]
MSASFVTCVIFCFALVSVLSANSSVNVKKKYICPSGFIRLSHRCYYISNDTATWHDAYFQCQSRRSHLAIIKNTNQDKLIRKALSSPDAKPMERWIGGRFDWQKKQWKWAASGRNVIFNGFHQSVNKTDDLQWSCIIMDPQFQYKWNHKSCLEEKHFICHKKTQTVTRPTMRNSRRDQLRNDIPIPDISNDIQANSSISKDLQKVLPAMSVASMFQVEVNTNLDPKFSQIKPNKRNRRKRKKGNPKKTLQHRKEYNNNSNHSAGEYKRDRRNKIKDDALGVPVVPMKIHYRTYKERSKSPLHPRPIVEEFNFDRP